MKVAFTAFDDIALRVKRAKSEMPRVGQYGKPDDASQCEVVHRDKYHCTGRRLARTPAKQNLHIHEYAPAPFKTL